MHERANGGPLESSGSSDQGHEEPCRRDEADTAGLFEVVVTSEGDKAALRHIEPFGVVAQVRGALRGLIAFEHPDARCFPNRRAAT